MDKRNPKRVRDAKIYKSFQQVGHIATYFAYVLVLIFALLFLVVAMKTKYLAG